MYIDSMKQLCYITRQEEIRLKQKTKQEKYIQKIFLSITGRMLAERLKQTVSPQIRLQGTSPYSFVLERISGTHKYLVNRKIVPTHLHMQCSVPASSSTILTQNLNCCQQAIGFHYILCLAAQRKGMVISMKENICRFLPKNGEANDINILNFVYETKEYV